MQYRVEFSRQASRQMKKLDRQAILMIKAWVMKNLEGTTQPRWHGKALKGQMKGLWRYRVGDYRLIAEIQDKVVTIVIVEVGHRREIYR